MLKKILIAPLLVVLVSTLAFGFQQGALWEKFNSPEGKFNILAPSKLALKVGEVDSVQGKLTLYLYSTSNSSGYFLASYGDYLVGPKDANEAESVLDGVRDGIQAGTKTEIVSEKKILIDGYPGREITTRKTDQGEVVIFKWRIYLVGRRLYENAVGTLQKDSESPDIMKFLTSFDLNK
jgi:hypothetical protein